MARPQTPSPVRGTQDMLGDMADRFHHVLRTFDNVRRLYGFRRCETPVIEPTAVFARSLGETTDVVAKEMYTFEDRGGEGVTLRPEFTAGVCRAYLTNGWQQHAPVKVALAGPLFRYERPQKGRYRQFHQLDAEVIGADSPLADVELLVMADHLLRDLGVAAGVTLRLNTLGDGDSRARWRDALVAHFEGHRAELSEDSVRRLGTNPLRILDSKEACDRPAADTAPVIDDYLSAEALDRFAAVTEGLDAAGVAWTRDARLVRGLDYYRHTAFEFVTDRLGAQGTVLGGGRYDGLIEALGGPATGAVGWAAGVERLAMLLEAPSADEAVEVAVIPDGPGEGARAAAIVTALRRAGVRADMDYAGKAKRRIERARGAGAAGLLFIRAEDHPDGVLYLRGGHGVAADALAGLAERVGRALAIDRVPFAA